MVFKTYSTFSGRRFATDMNWALEKGYIDSKGSGNGMIWKKMYHFFMLNNEEYLQHYHTRSNAESTVHTIKSKFVDRARSKLWTAQVNEVLCKIIAHNICCVIMEMNELGLESNFCPNGQITARNV